MTVGIEAAGAYIPRMRLPRKLIADANSWLNPALSTSAKGERAICNWDEDAVTMAVEAARDALQGHDRGIIASLSLASTTYPFIDRLNAAIVADALNLSKNVAAIDLSGSQRAATSALQQALRIGCEALIVATEKRRAKAASSIEIASGDAAAALVVGARNPFARLIANATETADFVDHYRTPDSEYDYQWEERWIRDVGYMRILPPIIRKCLNDAGVSPSEVAHFCMASLVPRVAGGVAKAVGIPDAAVADDLYAGCGNSGAAHPLLMLVAVLEKARPGERILVAGFGQGADVLLFEMVSPMPKPESRLGVAGYLSRRQQEQQYVKYLANNDMIDVERGMRAEVDKLTPLSALWRNHATVTSFLGGQCRVCGTAQFPKSRICVNPNCNAVDSQDDQPFAEKIGRINSYTADRLTYSPDPPACYGMIQFEGGGRWMMDFTDIDAADLDVGRAMRMVFRVKDIDNQRGFRRYFWKAAPVAENSGSA